MPLSPADLQALKDAGMEMKQNTDGTYGYVDQGVANQPPALPGPGSFPEGYDEGRAIQGYVSRSVQLVSSHLNKSNDDVPIDMSYAAVAFGNDNLEDVQRRTGKDTMSLMHSQQLNAAEQLVPQNDLIRYLLPAVDSFGMSAAITKATVAGTGAGAAIASGAPPIMPLAATMGGMASGFTAAAYLAVGAEMKRLTDMGLTAEQARPFAIVGGTINGAIELGQNMLITGVAGRMFKDVAEKAAVKALVENGVSRFFAATIGEGAEEVTQEGVQIITDHIVEERFGKVDPDRKDIATRLVTAFQQGALGGAVGGATANTAGAALGVAHRLTVNSKNPLGQNIHAVLGMYKDAISESTAEKAQAQLSVKAELYKGSSTDVRLGDALREKAPTQKIKSTNKTVQQAEAELSKIDADLKKAKQNLSDSEQAYNDEQDPILKQGHEVDIAAHKAEIKQLKAEKKIAEFELAKTKAEAGLGDQQITAQRKAEILQDISDIEKKLQDAKVEAQKEENDDRIAAIDAELQTTTDPMDKQILENEKEDLQVMNEALDDGLITGDDAAALRAKVPQKRKREIIKLVFDNVLALMREAGRISANNAIQAAKVLDKYLSRSGLSAEDQRKFMSTILSLRDAEDLQEAFPNVKLRVSELLAKAAERETDEELKKLIKKTAPKTKDNKNEGRYTEETQQLLDTFVNFIHNPQAARDVEARTLAADASFDDQVRDASDKQIAALVLETGTQKLAAEISATQKDLDYWKQEEINADAYGDAVGAKEARKKISQLNNKLRSQKVEMLEAFTEHKQDLVKRLKKIMKVGKEDRVAKKLEQMQGWRSAAIRLVAAINNKRPESLREGESNFRLPSLKQNIQHGLRSLGASIFSWEGKVVDILLQDVPRKDREEFRELLGVEKEVQEAEAGRRKQMDLMITFVQAEVNKVRKMDAGAVVRRMIWGAGKSFGRALNLTFVDGNGQSVTLEMSKNEAIQLWLQFKDSTLRAGLENTDISEGNAYTFGTNGDTTEVALNDALDDVDKAMGIGLLQFYNQQYDRLNE